jgi:hypothetical protein
VSDGTRTQLRHGWPDDVRIRLLEQDADKIEAGLTELVQGQRAGSRMLSQVLAGVVVAAIMLAINLAIQVTQLGVTP